jgi:asparagine synthase (glutamine-hydrolysing)
LFLGYASYYSRYIEELLRRRDYRGAVSAVLSSRATLSNGGLALARLLPFSAKAQQVLAALAGPALRPKPEWMAQLSTAQRLPYSLQRKDWSNEVTDACRTFPLPSLLRYADRNAMRVSVENRVPFCVPSILEFAEALAPGDLFGTEHAHKGVLRDAFRDLIPREIIDRRKIGCEVPRSVWIGQVLSRLPESVARAEEADVFPFGASRLLRHVGAHRLKPQTADFAWRVFNYCEWVCSLQLH